MSQGIQLTITDSLYTLSTTKRMLKVIKDGALHCAELFMTPWEVAKKYSLKDELLGSVKQQQR